MKIFLIILIISWTITVIMRKYVKNSVKMGNLKIIFSKINDIQAILTFINIIATLIFVILFIIKGGF